MKESSLGYRMGVKAHSEWRGTEGGARSMIPRVSSRSLVSLSTKGFQWLHENEWGEAEIDYFYANWPAPQSGITRHPAFVRRDKYHPRLVFLGRWVRFSGSAQGRLQVMDRATAELDGAVEAEVLMSTFVQVNLLIAPIRVVGGWVAASDSLSLIVSGIAMMTKADLVRLIPTAPEVAGQLASLGWGEPCPVWTPDVGFLSKKPLNAKKAHVVQTRKIDPLAWWESDAGQRDHRTLSYLEKRMSLQELKEESCPSQRQGFFQRLGRLMRWS